MTRLKTAIVGASGRVGNLLVELLRDNREMECVGAIVRRTSPRYGEAVPGHEIHYVDSLDAVTGGIDLVIEFALPEQSPSTADFCAARGAALLVGTTGHEPSALAALHAAAEKVPVLLAPNTSLGVAVLHEIASQAAALLGAQFEMEIFESHHRAKRDAPSGTALSLASRLSSVRGDSPVSAREGLREPGTIGISSARGGDIVGEHTIYFLGDGERLELTHRATDRSIFARGALQLGARLVGKERGFYAVRDVLSDAERR